MFSILCRNIQAGFPSGDLLKFRPKALALSIVDFMLPAEDRNLQG